MIKMEKVPDKKALEILSEGNHIRDYYYNGNSLYILPEIVSSTRYKIVEVSEKNDTYIDSYVIVSFDDL